MPIGPISALAILWYGATLLISAFGHINPWFTNWRYIVPLVLVSMFCSLAVGPAALLPFVVLTVAAWLHAVSEFRKMNPKRSYILLTWVGVIVFVFAIVWGSIDRAQHRHWRTADWLIKWEGTALSRQLVNRLKQQGCTSLSEARDIVDRSTGYEAADAADVLVSCGQPKEDVPRMIALEKRLESRQWPSSFMHDQLAKATGIALESTATATDWERAWSKSLRSSARSTTGTAVGEAS